jgi:hypothetical protein
MPDTSPKERSMSRKLFAAPEPAEVETPEIALPPAEAEAPAPDTLETRLALLSLPEQGSTAWGELKAGIELRAAEIRAELDNLNSEHGKLFLAAHIDPAANGSLLAEAEARAAHCEDLLTKINLALAALKHEHIAALTREGAAAREAALERARELMRQELADAARLDHLLRQANIVAASMHERARQFTALGDVVKPLNFSRLSLRAGYESTVFASAPVLAELLGIGRDRPIAAMQTAVQLRLGQFARFGVTEVPEIDTTGVVLPTKPAVDWTARDVGIHGVVIRGEPMTTGGVVYSAGDVVPGEIVVSWPKKNLRALVGMGRIELLPPPEPADAEAAAAETLGLSNEGE